MALTDIGLKALRPKGKVYVVTDGEGLYIEVSPSGRLVWRYRYRLNGKTEKVTFGKYPALSLRAARVMREAAASYVVMGRSPAREKQLAKVAASEETSLAQFAARYIREVQSRDRKNLTMPLRYLEKDILPFIGNKRVGDITTDDVRAVIWRKKDHGFDAAAGQVRGMLKRLLDYAVTCGLARVNPVLALPMRHVHRSVSRDRALEPDEIRQFLYATLESNMRRQFKIALRLLLLTMVRKSELLLARWADVHWEVAEWHIPVEHSKTGKPHIVYLSSQAVALFKELQALAGGSELVLPGRGTLTKPFAHNCINTALKKSLQGQEIPAFTIHDLRRTASTLLHENGWASDVVEKALNHTIGGVRGVYNRAQYASQRRAMLQFWADYIECLMGNNKVVLANFGGAHRDGRRA